MKRHTLLLIIVFILILAVIFGCSFTPLAELKRYEASFLQLFDTVSIVVGYDTSKESFSAVSQSVHDQLQVYHQLYDIYSKDLIPSIKTINDNAGIAPVKVDQRIIDLLKLSKDIYTMTNGKTNIALGAVLKIWHSYREDGINEPENAKLPPMDTLREAALHTNIDDLIIDEQASTVYLKDPLMSLDVGAVAKGYATEQVAQNIEQSGKTNILLSIGGNVRAIGAKPDGTAWGVGIENPQKSTGQESLFLVNINGLSVVTSGAYERYYTVDGAEYNHIIDPQTLLPATYFDSVTIITKDSGLADGLSTALFCMPLNDGQELLKQLGNVDACWVRKDGSIEMTDGFAKLIRK